MSPATNYAEIQQDEVEALASIFMEEFHEEEAGKGAWNKAPERRFRIRIKPTLDEGEDVWLQLSVRLPATYPKTLPHLHLSFSDNVNQKAQNEAQNIILTKPKSLVGTEMIFEIATLLQDILDQTTAGLKSKDVPTLDEERAMRDTANAQKAERVEKERQEEQARLRLEEEQALAQMMEQEKTRLAKRKSKPLIATDNVSHEDGIPGTLSFDQSVPVKTPNGAVIMLRTVCNRVKYRQGPVSTVFKVQPWAPREENESLEDAHAPSFLVLKECHVELQKNEESMKKHIQNLEARLDRLKTLAAHPSITRPLNFRIQRSGDGSTVSWEVSVLTVLAEKGSMHDLLDTVGALNIGSTRAWVIQLIEGLEFYHRNGIIHAGVHLNNVLLEKTETGTTVVKLSDGGYHQDLHLLQNRTNAAYSTAASAYWNAPEVSNYAGRKPVAATDVWDLGVVLLQMMFGLEVKSLYQSPNALLETLDLSRSLRELLDKVFKADFKKRPSSFELLPSEFLRNDDPILEDQVSHSLIREDLSASLSTFKTPRQRRDSMHAGYTSSRYANDFVESGRLGRGGYGEVVKARNKLDGRFYAIKLIRQSTPAALDSVLSEIILLSQLNHPHVVRYFTAWIENEGPPDSEPDSSSDGSSPADGLDVVFGKSSGALDFISSSGPNIQFGYGSDEEDISSEAVDEDDSDGAEVKESDNAAVARRRSSSYGQATKTTLYIQMEYCERQTLRDLIRGGVQDDAKECWRLFRQILEGLAHIHSASIVHRDLKPENIFIDNSKDVRIGDFGLARPGDSQASVKAKGAEDPYASFTKSVGTALYVAPEVRSSGHGKYNEKADMYSLGIILFEMSFSLSTGMERVQTLARLRKEEHVLPAVFEEPEKSTQGDIIMSLVNHKPAERPGSAELLRGGQIPVQIEDDLIRTALRLLNDSKSSFRSQLVSAIFSQAGTAQSDPVAFLRDQNYDAAVGSNFTSEDLLLRTMVKEKLASVFRCHGAIEVSRHLLTPYSFYYSNHANAAVLMLDSSANLVQLPYDLTLPNARTLAKHPYPGRKTFTFGEVYRESYSGGHPKAHGEVDFDIISYDNLDLALREAEVIKVIDEVLDAFPSMGTVQMCYHVNHSRLLDAILTFCNIDTTKRIPVKETISRLNIGPWNWTKIRNELRAPSIAVAATSLDELMRFDFRDTFDKAIPKLRSILQETADLETTFTHLHAVTVYLDRFNLKRKIYINPLSSYNEKFYRGNLLFQCLYDNKKRDVFAAGGRYDRLIHEHRPTPGKDDRHAVGFNLSWQGLCTSMTKYHKSIVNSKTKKRHVFDASWTLRRCDVLIDSFDLDILRTTGVKIAQELWANEISAELVMDTDPEQTADYNQTSRDSKDVHSWIVLIKEGVLKVRSTIRKEDTELRHSELIAWLKSEIRDRDRADGRTHDKVRLLRQSSHQETTAAVSTDHEPDVRILTSLHRGKKVNRRTVIEEAQSRTQELLRSAFDGPIAAVETKDDIFEGLRETRLSDPESWKKFIQHAPAGERQYLADLQELLGEMAREVKAGGARNAFVYNFRTRGCIWYDLV